MKNNKALLWSVRNYIQYSVINHMKKNKKKYIFMCIAESHCCAGELNATLKSSHTSIYLFRKEKVCP